jgi:hypothetical protein
MYLTEEQKLILKKASSGYNGQDFSILDPEDLAYYTRRVEDAIKEVQALNANAFLFYYKNSEKVDIREKMLERSFYHAPMGIANFKSAKKHQFAYPENIKISQGVK